MNTFERKCTAPLLWKRSEYVREQNHPRGIKTTDIVQRTEAEEAALQPLFFDLEAAEDDEVHFRLSFTDDEEVVVPICKCFWGKTNYIASLIIYLLTVWKNKKFTPTCFKTA